MPAALPAQRAAELRRARQTRGFSGEAAAGSGSDRAAAPLALPRHRARREAGGGRHGEPAGAGPGRSLPAGGGRPPPGGCAPPRRQRTASRRRPPPARPAATGGCHSSAPREPPRGNGRQAAAQGGVGGWRLRGAKVSPLRSRVPGRRSPPAALPERWEETDPALTAGPTAPLSAAWARPSPPARSKVSLRPHLYGNDPLVSLRSPRDEADAGSSHASRGDGSMPSSRLGKSGRRQRPGRDGSRGKGRPEPRDRDAAPSVPPAPGKFAGSPRESAAAAPRSRRDRPPGPAAGAPPARDLPALLCRQPRRRGGFVARPVPPRRAQGPRPRGRSHRRGSRGRGAQRCRSRRAGRAWSGNGPFPAGVGLP